MSEENLLGPYRLLRKLGEGGMGVVYLGFDDALERRVAIKVLRLPERGGERAAATQARRFLREARSAARINHPNVVTIYGVGGEKAARPYIAMEYVEGGSLSEHLRQSGPMPWREATRAVRDALRGLAAAHARGVIHRDIKPGNLMRARGADGEGVVKLVDFGLARVVSGPISDGELTFPGAFVGSPSYSSPEQISGAPVIDGRADLYGLAASWYVLLAGQPPFVEEDPADVMQRHLREPFPDVRRLAPTVPEAVQEAIARASRKEPDERYESAPQMLAAVEEALALPADVVAASPRRISAASPRTPPPDSISDTVVELESRLALARASSDSPSQIAALRSLYGLYSQMDRRADALRAYREALALHIKMHAPANN
jgi:serine/threonine protein kinase